MYLVIKQELKHLTHDEFETLKELSHIAKNMYNVALYNIRQYFFDTGSYLGYNDNYHLCKTNENYMILNSNMAQQVIRRAGEAFISFFGLNKLKKLGSYTAKVIIPQYLPKDGYTTLEIGFVRLDGSKLILPYSNSYRKTHNPIEITIPPTLKDKKVKEIRIVPRQNAAYFEVQYVYEAEVSQREVQNNNFAAIDLGIDNLITIVTNTGGTLIIDGRKLKSINQQYNKHNAELQSLKDKSGILTQTKLQKRITRKRNNRVNDYISKACRYVIGFCLDNNVGTLVFGYNKNWQKGSDMGRVTNQQFVNIPFSAIKSKLTYLCELNGIVFVEQEESYTSQASFFDRDYIPVYGEPGANEARFSGRRVKRGVYRTANGYTFNADVNGALNILQKSKVGGCETLAALYHRGTVDMPTRVRVA